MSVQRVVAQVLDAIEEKSQESKTLSDEDILSLHSIFGSAFERALEIVGRSGSVVIYATETGSRSIGEIGGYQLFLDVNYCGCPAFRRDAVETGRRPTCKHVLALRIARITGTAVRRPLSEERFAALYASSFLLQDDQD